MSSTSTSTINKSEVEKFSNISWDPNGPLKPLLAMNSIRVPLIESNLDLRSPEKKWILDIGSGGGFLSEGLALHLSTLEGVDFEIVGLDPSQENVEVARAHLPTNLGDRVTYLPLAIEEYVAKYPQRKFDLVVSSEVIEHVDNPREFVKMAVQATKPGGKIIITTPGKTIFSYLAMIVFAEYIARLVPIGTHYYSKFVSPEECMDFLESNNCAIKDARGSFYNPLTNSWRWVFFKHFWYALVAEKM